MKLFRKILMIAALAAPLQACSIKEELPQEELPGITLRFFTGDGFDVKSDSGYEPKNGEDVWNENILSSVEYFLYQDGKTDQDAVFHGYLQNVTRRAPYSIPMTDLDVRNILCPGNARYFEVYAIANYSRIVPAATPGNSEDLTGTSVPTLEALTKELEMVQLSGTGEDVVSNQPNFLMSTEEALRVGPVKKSQTTIAETRVDLKRVASKLSIVVRIVPQVTFYNKTKIGEMTIDREELWEPRFNESTIYLVNGALEGQVSGEPLSSSDLYEHAPIYFDMSKGESHSFSEWKLRTNVDGEPVDSLGNVIDENNDVDPIYDEVTSTDYFYPARTPFYSYPQKWFYGSDEEPYLKLVIPWDRVEYIQEGGNTVRKVRQSKQYYYRVYCPGSTGDGVTCDAEFLRNHWYKVILNVGILGSETDGGEIIITGSYFVADWQERESSSGGGGSEGTVENDSDKEAEIKGARYLFVNKDTLYLYNINSLQIPYTTSDPCEIVNFSGDRYIFSGSTKTLQSIINKADWSVSLDLITNQTGAHISFNHVLDNDLNGTTYDVSEYTFRFRLRQISNTDYYKDLVIIQSPAIKIDLERNDVTTSPYSAYVNGGTVSGNSPTWSLGSVPGSGTSSNNNYNMVIIETTVLPYDSDFMLGDPRTTYIDNLNFSKSGNNYTDTWPTVTGVNRSDPDTRWSKSSPCVQGGSNRQLSYYRPAIPGSEADATIAPIFRIASSRGATQPMSYANAFRRCASYQEYGYPAGRWRLPTVAEIHYIAKLNADGKIERLLGGEKITINNQQQSSSYQASKTNSNCYTDYWCNSGYMRVYDGVDSNWVTNNGGVLPAPDLGTDTASLTNGTTKYVRCVYDDWYWNGIKYQGTDVSTISSKTTFTWGDLQ
ncbi:MAG: hypothetical protein J5667_01120 [Bacteroidales bacterium]|nr:hypothetical protein [Bacteroidales bacterium]